MCIELYQIGSNTVSNNISIGYSGGSGGFLLLHFLLLSNRYYCSLNGPIDSQWNIIDPAKWKSLEIWPNNINTKNSLTINPKIYFFCNPGDISELELYAKKKIIIYTSLFNQYMLAKYKNANWFVDKCEFTYNRERVTNWQNHYNDIKDISWPKCPSLKRINQLPECIKEELLNNKYTKKYYPRLLSFKEDLLKNHSKEISDGTVVYSKIASLIDNADIAIKLEDLINDYGKMLLTKLDLPPINSYQINLINKWKKLHTPEILKQLNVLP